MWIVFFIFTFLLNFNFLLGLRCLSCANDFVVWNWRHFFLKRNYGISSSDNLCAHDDYDPSLSNECSSSCFVFYLNGTDRETGLVQNLGIGRGCSAQFLSDEQYNQRGLGIYSRLSDVSHYLSHDFDKFELTEYWCFCAGDRCNTDNCFSQWRYYGYGGSYYRSSGRRASPNHNTNWQDGFRTGFNSAPTNLLIFSYEILLLNFTVILFVFFKRFL